MLHSPLIEDSDEKQHALVKHSKTKTIWIIVRYIISDIAKRPRSFKIGLFTIYLVVTFLALLESAVQLSPLIFIQLAETQSGDSDLLFTPMSSLNKSITYESSSTFINTTEINEYFNVTDGIFGSSPRWLLTGYLINNNTHVEKINQKLRTFVIILNQTQEISIGLGRRSTQNYLTANQVQVSASTLRGLNASVGDVLQVNIDVDELISLLDGNTKNGSEDFFYSLIDSTINKPLRRIFGDDFEYQIIQREEIQQGAEDVVALADLLESNQELKNLSKEYIEEYINSQDIPQDEKKLLLDIIEIEYQRNLSEDARTLERFAYKLNESVTVYEIEMAISSLVAQSANFTFDVIVTEKIEAPRGKWQDGFNALLMDQQNATNILVEGLLTKFEDVVIDKRLNDDSTIGAVAELIPIDFVKSVVWNASQRIYLPDYSLCQNLVLKNRLQVYQDKNTIKSSIIDITNQFFKTTGFDYPVSASSTLATAVSNYFILKNFIDNLIAAATMILLMLSILLIYSLMIGDVDEKTYEFGMLRALGFRKSWLIVLLLFQALTFAIPGLLLALITCYILNSLVSMLIFATTDMVSNYVIADQALYLAVSLGILIPIISNIFPIQRALSKTLRDSLDLYHRTIQEVMVNVVKLEKMGISLTQTFCSLLLVAIGFVSYYLIPMAFIFNNVTLALNIINVIFIIMIIGFMLLVNLFQGPLERAILNCILWICKFDRNLKQIIFKNLSGHASRNWKTTFMYSLALSFILFAGASLTLDSKVIGDALQSALGGDVTVMVMPTDKIGLDEYEIRKHLESEMMRDKTLIQDYSFNAILLTHFPFLGGIQWFTTMATFPWARIRLGGVEPNYLETIMQEYYLPDDYDDQVSYPKLKSGKKDGVYGLYDRSGNLDIESEEDVKKVITQMNIRDSYYKGLNISRPNVRIEEDREINIIIPQGYKYEISIDVNTPSLIWWGRYYRINVRHTASKVPGFEFSSYRQVTQFGQGIISMPDQLYMVNSYLRGDIRNISSIQQPYVREYLSNLPKGLTYGLPKTSLRVKFARQTSKTERVDFCNRLRNYFRNDQTLLFDVKTLKEEAENAFFYIQILNIVVAVIALTLSFFLILISFVGNVKDNSWEFGVLRAIGLNKKQLTRIYIYEAISLITASGLLGTFIGISLAILLTLQILMFIELPFVLMFPTATFLITCLGGFVTAIVASYLAVLDMKDKSISVILKGLL
ncbi:unnamed protein product [Paramecium octaurelia]|uniref:ABC3 transporter permease C-terminal domain-containing protein n=1 Tax=Paramecium octaurelia TaxID=43137 RepID=A0A8S1X420_PAROT|nr:unnamed protein product [Paramecium octaurelia]